MGYEAVSVYNGAEAIVCATKSPFDMLISDVCWLQSNAPTEYNVMPPQTRDWRLSKLLNCPQLITISRFWRTVKIACMIRTTVLLGCCLALSATAVSLNAQSNASQHVSAGYYVSGGKCRRLNQSLMVFGPFGSCRGPLRCFGQGAPRKRIDWVPSSSSERCFTSG